MVVGASVSCREQHRRPGMYLGPYRPQSAADTCHIFDHYTLHQPSSLGWVNQKWLRYDCIEGIRLDACANLSGC